MKEATENNSTRRNKYFSRKQELTMLESKSNFHQKIDSRQVNFPSDERDVTFRIRPIVALSALLCTRKKRFHSSKKRISLWVAFSRRQFFAPLNRDDLQDLLSSSSVSRGGAQIAFMRELRAVPSSAYTPLSYIPLWQLHRDVNQSALPSFHE